MSNYEYRPRNAIFQENMPETTNMRWGIERILGLYGMDHQGQNCKDAILTLERYMQTVAGIYRQSCSEITMGASDGIPHEALLDMAAQEANVEFPQEEPYRWTSGSK